MKQLPRIDQTFLLDKVPVRVSAQCLRQDGYIHMHPHTQLIYTLSGELSHQMRNEHFSQTKGALSAVLPYISHRTALFNSEDTPVIIFISFYDDFLLKHGYDYFPYGKNPHFDGWKIPLFTRPESIESEIRATSLIREMRSEFELLEKADFGRIADLLAAFFRCICTEKLEKRESTLFRRQAMGTNAAAKYIEKNYCEKITVDTLAEIAGMSRSTFTSRFREFTGLSALDFLLSVRITRASNIMAERGEHTMDEIAAACGLYDHTNLVRVFKKYLGKTPTEHISERLHQYRTNEVIKENNNFNLENWVL